MSYILYATMCFISTDGLTESCHDYALQPFASLDACRSAGPVVVHSVARSLPIAPKRFSFACVNKGANP